MKKTKKIILIIGIIVVTYILTYSIYADDFTDIWSTGKNFLDKGSDTGGAIKNLNTTATTDAISGMIDFLWGLGLLVICIATLILGMKYMMVNPNERSRIKQATTPYIIGVVVIFGAVTIWKFVIDLLEGSIL